MTRPPLDSTTSESAFRRSMAAWTSDSLAFMIGSRLVFWLQPVVSDSSVSGYVSGTVCCFSTSTPRMRVSSSERSGRVVIDGRAGLVESASLALLLSLRHPGNRCALSTISDGRAARPGSKMAQSPEVTNMALFCDFENIALGVQDAKYDKFDIGKVLERLLLKGSIVVKKAYCDWDRYKSFKAPMHEASFEMIEIPHVRQSGKNSADIRMVDDAVDRCYTKSHVDTFVVISGDSDFSPLVSKLRENAKTVIGVGVKNST